MKKLFLLSTLSLATMLGSFAAPFSVSASSSELIAPGDPVMTIDEILEYREAVDTEIMESCVSVSNWQCVRDAVDARRDSDANYPALETFLNYLVFVSAINPAERTMQVVFNSKNYGLMMYPGASVDSLLELRIGWSEPGYSSIVNIPQDESSAPEYFHYMYNGSAEENGEDWIAPYTKFDISWDDPGFELTTNGIIQHNVISKNTNSFGASYIADCLDSRYYQVGMECRAVFSKRNGGVLYVPYSNGVPAWPYAYAQESVDSESETTIFDDTQAADSGFGENSLITTNPTDTEPEDILVASDQDDIEVLQALAVGDLGQFTAEPTTATADGEAENNNDKILWCIVAWLTLVPITIFFGVKRPEKRF